MLQIRLGQAGNFGLLISWWVFGVYMQNHSVWEALTAFPFLQLICRRAGSPLHGFHAEPCPLARSFSSRPSGCFDGARATKLHL
jgi:hypothetical protein